MKLQSIAQQSHDDIGYYGRNSPHVFQFPNPAESYRSQNARSIIEGQQSRELEAVRTNILDNQSIRSKIDNREQSMAVGHVSYFFGARAVGAIVFSLVGGFALENFSKPTIFRLSALCPMLLFLYVTVIFEENEDSIYSEEATAEDIRTMLESHMMKRQSTSKDQGIIIDSSKKNDINTPMYPTKPSQHQDVQKKAQLTYEQQTSNSFIQDMKEKLGLSTSLSKKRIFAKIHSSHQKIELKVFLSIQKNNCHKLTKKLKKSGLQKKRHHFQKNSAFLFLAVHMINFVKN